MVKLARPWAHQSPDTRLRHIKFAREQEELRSARLQENEAMRFDTIRQDLGREQQRRDSLQENEVRRFDDLSQAMDRERGRKAGREQRMAGMQRFREVEQRQQPARRELAGILPVPGDPSLEPAGGLISTPERLLSPGVRAAQQMGPQPFVPGEMLGEMMVPLEQIDLPRQFVKEEVIEPIVPDFSVTGVIPDPTKVGFGPRGITVGGTREVTITDEFVEEAASWILDPINLLPVVGWGPNLMRAARAGVPALRTLLKNPSARGFLDDAMRGIREAGERGGRVPGVGPEDVARGAPEQPKLPGLEDPHVARADPGPPPPEGPPPTKPRGPSPDDPEFDDIQRVALGGEQPEETLVRRHQGAIDTAKRDAAIEVREGNQMLVDVGLGRTFRQSVVAREEGAFNELNSLLHNPSQVASGERVVPDNLRPIYDRLRAGTDWEQAARVDFNPDMALVEDYFFRGWQPPEGMFTGEARGALGRSPAFKLPRINATYDEMTDAGFKPLFENPAEQMRYSRMMGVRYREQMKFIEQIRANEIALQDLGGAVPDGWRVPRVGPAFEGKPYAKGDEVMFTRRWAVPDSLANRLENAYGKTPNLGKGTAFGKTINFQAAVDAAVFMPKRAKLIGSVFQHVDFLNRSHVGAWTGFIDSLRRGHPIESVYHLLKWPKSATDIVHATFSPGFRAKLAKLAVDDTPLFEGRNLSNRMISKAGLSLRDETILPELDQVIRQVEAEGRAARWGKAPLRLLGDLERAWRRGLFEGVYPAAILTDVKNNIAPAIVRQHPRATDEQLAGMIAKAANTSYSTIPAAQSVVQNQQARWFLTRFLFSMGENEGLLRAFTGAIKGENAAYFRTRLLGTYLGIISLANTIHFASTGKPLPFDRYAPISKDKWGPLPLGYNRDFAAPNIPLTGRSGTEITLDLMGQMDTAFRVLNPKSFLNARVSVPVRAIESQRTGRDFFGAPIDTVGPGGIFSRTAQLVQDLFAPIGPGQAGLEALRSNIEETEGLIQPGEDRLGTTGIGIQATGVNLRAETTPQLLDRIRGDVMREMGIEGRYEDLDQITKPDVDAKVEERIGPELEMRRETSELRGQTTLEGQFYRETDILRGEQEEAQLSADAKLNSDQWAGDVWRKDLGDRQREGYIRRDERKEAAGVEFEDHPAKNKIDKAINDYFDVNIDGYAQPDGTTDWDGFFGAQDAALAPLSPADKKAVMDKVVHKYDTPTVKEFRKAQDVVDKFYDKPKYEGLSVKEGERLDEFINVTVEEFQRRRLRETGSTFRTRIAIIVAAEESGLPEKLLNVALLLQRERFRKMIVNPERDEWLVRNERILAKFYPDLLERELSREQEAELGGQAFEAIAAR